MERLGLDSAAAIAMIAFGTSITKPDVYAACAEPASAGPPSRLGGLALPSVGSIFRSYNAVLERAAGRDDLEALVLVHQDAEIVDADFCAGARRALTTPKSAVVGCVGAIGVRSIAWWEGSVTCASFIHRYEDQEAATCPHSRGRGPRRRRTPARRGRHGRRLRAPAVAVGRANAALRRVARPPARLRHRLLPAGSRRRAQGRHGRLPRHPHPPARPVRGSGGMDPGPHAGGGEVGRARAGLRHRSRDVEGARAARRGRARGGSPPRPHEPARDATRRRASSSARWPRRPRASRGGSRRRCACVGRSRVAAAEPR